MPVLARARLRPDRQDPAYASLARLQPGGPKRRGHDNVHARGSVPQHLRTGLTPTFFAKNQEVTANESFALRVPGIDGFEANRRLPAQQSESQWPGAPIAALTANGVAGDHHAMPGCRHGRRDSQALALGSATPATRPLGGPGLRPCGACWPPPSRRGPSRPAKGW